MSLNCDTPQTITFHKEHSVVQVNEPMRYLHVCYVLHRYIVMTRKCIALAKSSEGIMAGPCTFIGRTGLKLGFKV